MKRQGSNTTAPTKSAGKKAAASGATAPIASATRRKAKASGAPSAKAASSPSPDLYGSIHALLHTMRVIEQHEEPLCQMQDELKRTGRLSAPHRRKLQQLVNELPADVYQHDLQALREAAAA